jgi:recombination protein RecT
MSAAIAQRPNTNTAVATVDTARQFLMSKDVQAQLAHMADKHMTPDHMCRLVLTAVQKTPKLIECFATPQGKRSIGLCMLTAGQSGLPIDGRLSHIVPFRNKGGYMEAVWMPDYKGLIQLAYNHPKVAAIWTGAVYENDRFEYSAGLNIVLNHAPLLRGDPGALYASYAVCKLTTGESTVVVLPEREIERIRASSRGSDQPDSPWNTAEGEMWKKSAVKALCKIIPQSKELKKVLEIESEFEDTGTLKNSVTIDVQAQPEPRFAKPLPPPEAAEAEAAPVISEPQRGSEESPTQATAEPAAEPPPAPQSKAAELAGFFQREAGAEFAAVKTVLLKNQPKAWLDIKDANSFEEMPDAAVERLNKTRVAWARQVKAGKA